MDYIFVTRMIVDKSFVLVYYYSMNNFNNQKYKNLFNAFLSLENLDEVRDFCIDLMTPQEIDSFADRWEVARQLNEGNSQRKVSADTNVSIATVTRVNRFLNRGADGYKTVLFRLSKNNAHHHSH